MKNFLHRLNRRLYRRSVKDIPDLRYPKEQLRSEGYSSQYGQDKFINEQIFKKRTSGVFVDIGANDGVSLSNTLYFENLGWQGVAVEPLPEAFQKLRQNRECVLVNACVNDEEGEVRFMAIKGYAEMLSGISERYDKRHLARIKRAQRKHGCKVEEISVPSFRFSTVLQNASISSVDYLNIDTEGCEYEILKDIDFQATPVEVITVENNYHDQRYRKLLRNQGFELIAIVGDEVYRRTR